MERATVNDWLEQAIESGVADVLFGIVILGGVAILLFAVMFFLLLVRHLWWKLRHHSWGSVLVSVEQRAFMSRRH